MKIDTADLMPATRACLVIALGVPLPADCELDVDMFTARDLPKENPMVAIKAKIGGSTWGYSLPVPDGFLEERIKLVLEAAFLHLLMSQGLMSSDAGLRRKLLG